ncbi:hypothetical protein [Pseudomonas chlororaphis]|uniref:hypothetical protein n=1 Tax=Pseudomonas chlororaphis TaxID=587753 RepID=UPI0015DDC02B|nr:hypothetical protein [Pseudomonas chlororaphis]QLL15361.1 hypothetical protein H0I86_09815 [Pseudomonas chlororaphis subsp. aurantiaca]
MDESAVTLVVGLAGIVSTLLVSALGLYYTAKARVAPLRDALFSRQLDVAVQISHLQSRIRVFATILSAKDALYCDEARADIGEYYKQFSELEARSAVILPVELWLELKELSNAICCLLQEYDEQGAITSPCMLKVEARMTKVALLCRTITGADQLSEHAIRLFSSRKDYQRVVDMEISKFESMHGEVNRSGA